MKFLYRLFVRFLIVVIVLSLLSLGYLHFYGFPDFLKEYLVSELYRAGYATQFGSIRLDIFRGVVATDATFADAKTPDQPLAQIDELELQFSLTRLMHKQSVIRAIHIANAVIAIPTPPDENGPARFTASDAYATFQFADDGSIQVNRLTGVYCGIRLNVSGRIKPRSATPINQATANVSTGGGRPFLFLTKALREINQIQVTLPPQLDLDFDIDLAQPLAGHVVAKLRGSQLQYRNLQLTSAAADVEMTDGAIVLSRCEASLYGGEVDLHGRYDITMGQFDVSLSSSTDPAALVPLFIKGAGPILRDLHVEENPKIEARYRLSPETGSLPELTGTVEMGGLTFRGVEFRTIKFTFEDRGPQAKFNGVEVVTPEGRLDGKGEYNIESSDFAYEFDSTIDPTKLLPLMINGEVRKIVEPAWFETPPHIVAKVSGDFVDPDALAYDARVDAYRCSYRGVGLESATARLKLRESRLDVEDLELERREGGVHGMLFADFNRHRVNFDLGAKANPSEIVGLLGEKAVKIMTPYRFGPRTEANARGVVDFDNPTGTVWTARVANEGFSYWKFTADRAQATLVFTNDAMQINDFDADFYSGKLKGRAAFVFSQGDPSYSFDFSVDRVDVNSVLSATEDHESKVTGLLTGQATISGRGNDLSNLNGAGQLNVTDGVLWQAPVFGIFSEILGKTKATRAQASFTIANQAVSTEDMQIAAGAFTAQSRGQLGFDGKLDFRVQAQFLRAWPGIGWISPLIGKLLEYKVGGTIGDPKYRPVNLPKELLPSR